MAKLRVLVLSSESPSHIWGGRGEHIKKLYPHMRGQIDMHLVCWDKRVENVWYDFSHPYQDSVAYYDPNDGGFKNGAINEMAMLTHMLKRHNEKPFDLVHAHEWDAVIPALRFREITGVPVVTTFHLFQHQVRTIEQGAGTDDELYPLVAEDWGLIASDAVIVVSHDMAGYARNFKSVDRPIDVIHNGVDFGDVPKWMKGREPTTKPRAIFCGRISKQKGIEAFMDAAEMCDDFTFEVIGQLTAIDPKDAETHPYAIRLRKLESEGRLTWLGHIEGPDRFNCFVDAVYVVMPSIIEPFGIVALEALMMGVPLVTTRVDGMNEFLDDSNSHLCGPTGADIVAKLRELERNPELRDSTIAAGLETAQAFTWQGAAEKTLAVYKRTYEQNRDRSVSLHA